ncbi:MAG: HD domain-containing phosphohydrolase [Pseudomonadota bacterium]
MDITSSKILLVDDEPHICELLARWLSAEGFQCRSVFSGEEALDVLQEDGIDLVVTDILMPGMSGLDLLTITRKLFGDIAVIIATAVDDRKTAIMALEMGAYGYVAKPFERNEIVINAVNALERRRLRLMSREYEKELESLVEQRTRQIRRREEQIVLHLLSAAAYRDHETGAHVRRIGLGAALLAAELQLPFDFVGNIRLAAAMHDIGKIGIPDRILQKPAPLTFDEFEEIKKHTWMGAAILSGSDIPLLHMAEEIAMSHHEQWSGRGYPRGLAGDVIPVGARIVAILDVYDALIHKRVYKPAKSEAEAISIIQRARSIHFDPRVTDCFMDHLPGIRRIRQEIEETEYFPDHIRAARD